MLPARERWRTQTDGRRMSPSGSNSPDGNPLPTLEYEAQWAACRSAAADRSPSPPSRKGSRAVVRLVSGSGVSTPAMQRGTAQWPHHAAGQDTVRCGAALAAGSLPEEQRKSAARLASPRGGALQEPVVLGPFALELLGDEGIMPKWGTEDCDPLARAGRRCERCWRLPT